MFMHAKCILVSCHGSATGDTMTSFPPREFAPRNSSKSNTVGTTPLAPAMGFVRTVSKAVLKDHFEIFH